MGGEWCKRGDQPCILKKTLPHKFLGERNIHKFCPKKIEYTNLSFLHRNGLQKGVRREKGKGVVKITKNNEPVQHFLNSISRTQLGCKGRKVLSLSA